MKTRSIDNGIFFREVERLLDEGDSVTIRVRGNSMRPLLRNGRDRIILKKATEEDQCISPYRPDAEHAVGHVAPDCNSSDPSGWLTVRRPRL